MSMSPSAKALWDRYRRQVADAPEQPYACFHFCDNAADADECADLVVRDIKRATASSVIELARRDTPAPPRRHLHRHPLEWRGRGRQDRSGRCSPLR